MTRILARCHPALEPILPKPRPARGALPDWLRQMPSDVPAPSLGGDLVRTLKHCPPFLDAMGAGVMVPLACDLHVSGGEIRWDWDPPVITDAPITRAPIGVHVPEQASGAPLGLGDTLAIKFTSFWTLEVPEGWQLYFMHPANRADLPFLTLSGLVSADRFGLGYVHFPAVWTDPTFEGTLAAGTPVAQVLALPRAAPTLETRAMNQTEIAQSRDIQEALQAERGVYRKSFRGEA